MSFLTYIIQWSRSRTYGLQLGKGDVGCLRHGEEDSVGGPQWWQSLVRKAASITHYLACCKYK